MKKIINFVLIFLTFLPLFCFAYDNHIVISEVMVGRETSTDEYIKLYNSSDNDINLLGYKIIKKTTSGSPYNLISNFLEDSIIKSRSYFLISHKDYVGYGYSDIFYTNNSYSISKDNSIYLINKDGGVEDLIGFGECYEKEGEKCLDNIDNNYIYKRKNNIDTNNNFDDFEVLSVTAETNNIKEDIAENNIEPQVFTTNNPVIETWQTKIVYQKDLIISEIYPNPKEGGEEFIEIKNIGNSAIDLNNYKIKDSSKRIFIIKSIILVPNQYVAFYKIETGISLNNSGEEHVYLITPNNDIFYDLKYFDSRIGNSYAFDEVNKEYFWTRVITPGMSNVIEKENNLPTIDCKIDKNVFMRIAFNIDCSDSYDEDGDELNFSFDMGDGKIINNKNNFYYSYFDGGNYSIKVEVVDINGGSSEKTYKIKIRSDLENSGFLFDNLENKNVEENIKENCQNIDIEELQNIDLGECVSIKSTVILEKDVFSKNYFYVNGAQIYYSKDDLDGIQEGNLISASGIVSSNYGEKRIKIKDKNDILILDKNKFVIPNKISNINDLDFNIAGLVSVEGVLENKTKSSLELLNNDQYYDVYIKDNLNINLDSLKEGNYVEVSGIVNKRNDKTKIFLRKQEDIKIIENVKDKEVDFVASAIFEGNYGYGEEQQIKEYKLENIKDNKKSLIIVGVGVFGLIICIVVVLLLKNKTSK